MTIAGFRSAPRGVARQSTMTRLVVPLHLVGLLLHRHALDQVGEVGHAVDLGEDRPHVGIPLRQARAALDLVAVVDVQARAVDDLLGRQLLARLVDDDDRHVAAHGDQPALAVLADAAVLDLHRAVEVGLDERLVDRLRDAAHVERAHGELRARLADRLRGDDAHRLADVDGRAAGQIAAVALAAHAVGGLAGQHRADAHFLDLRLLDGLDLLLLDQLAGLDDHLLGGRILDVLGRRAAEHALGQRDDDLAGVDHGLHVDAAVGAAVVLGDDAVLRHVDETAREVARVRRLERRVGQALARAVRRVEVLEHRQALLEVGDDRRLDDLARRLGHQAAHAGELPHLLLGAARAGVGHHVDGVDLLASRPFGVASAPPRCGPSSPWRSGRCTSTRRRPPCCTSRAG